MGWYYTFEAKEIQRFIMQSDKLRDMVGGSELVSQLCESFLDEALKAVGVRDPDNHIIAKAAGWARMKFDDEAQARQFYAAWPFMVSRFAPGLKVIQCLEPISTTLPDAIDLGFKALRAARNCNPAELPETGPLVERYPRTGAPAVAWAKEPKAKEPLPVDRATLRKSTVAEGSSVIEKISNEFRKYDWPLDMDEIVSGDSAYVAVIHADGNDLGAMVMNITQHLKAHPDAATQIYQALTQVVEKTTLEAVRKACEATLFPEFRQGRKKIAARPIVLGGDDLTIIVRADLAVAFTEVFLQEFEACSRQNLKELLGKFGIKELPEALTACAGIAFVKKAYPFSSAYRMAETLCEHTKKVAKADREKRIEAGRRPVVPSSLSFHRISTSMAEGYSEVKSKELTGRGHAPVKFWFGPYAVSAAGGGLPSLAALRKLTARLRDLPTSSARTLIATLHANPEDAPKDFARILQVADGKDGKGLQGALAALTQNQQTPLWSDREATKYQTPLLDAHLLREIEKGDRYAQG